MSGSDSPITIWRFPGGPFGGDEFVLLLPEQKDEKTVIRVAEKISEAFQNPFDLDGHVLVIICSSGISLYPDHSVDIDTILKNVDRAMYPAKHKGRNQYRLYKQT